MNDDKSNCGHGSKCGCPCHSAMGVFVILFGLTFLLQNLNVISESTAHVVWPSIIILAGLKKTFKGLCKCCHKGEKK